MGEYAKLNNGQQIKLGTCESLYYLRADQLTTLGILAKTSEVPTDIDEAGRLGYRFRFPFPDEDSIALEDMQGISNFDRGYIIPGSKWADLEGDFEHRTIGATGKHYRTGFEVRGALPCPFAKDSATRAVNHVPGEIEIVAQRRVEGQTMTVFRCVCCQEMFRASRVNAAYLAERLVKQADFTLSRKIEIDLEQAYAAELVTIANRIMAGYPAETLAVA